MAPSCDAVRRVRPHFRMGRGLQWITHPLTGDGNLSSVRTRDDRHPGWLLVGRFAGAKVTWPRACVFRDLLSPPRAPTPARIGLVGGLGFEPRQAESESAVLPLDDPPTEGVRLDG